MSHVPDQQIDRLIRETGMGRVQAFSTLDEAVAAMDRDIAASDDDDVDAECAVCRGIGEGQHEGQSCAACAGRG